ncbi:L-serine ammonia-lyase [Basilea psittacipulmonis]|uniref:L-serine dehydratase n=1 Tax=Basilea psittacipulmonis DSM 24701 TaxID=1072685 RepID=A0A077DEA4_9BURK|nr:L-serine ammonia-lyase [Basilea psittacipulmonis]AIL32501.1 serine dehydratase [Basilea psittacipulmonis DSM 24701]
MDYIGVFDMFKIGVGPSSSHTLGPWRAAQAFVAELKQANIIEQVHHVRVDLYGSLSLTGKGHSTDIAVMLGLEDSDPETIDTALIPSIINRMQVQNEMLLGAVKQIHFYPDKDIVFHTDFLPFHANGITFTAWNEEEVVLYTSTFYSIGGGFIVKETPADEPNTVPLESVEVPYPIYSAKDLLRFCKETGKSISQIVYENELCLRTAEEIDRDLDKIWKTMLDCAFIGCHTSGVLPGGLNVHRRAYDIHQRLMGEHYQWSVDSDDWIAKIRATPVHFRQIFKWVSCFAMAVNEVNASLGRVVTAPTNGSAGVIPAVLLYYMTIDNHQATKADIRKALMVAAVIGSLFKRSATISAAMGGCQAEIGVSSGMAAAALCELMGGSPDQVLIAAEVAVEHHLGLTCDPIAGLVQVPCIERNSMGAIKAINAAELAIETDPTKTKVPLDKVVATLWQTAQDMNTKYKETSEAGLAVAVSIADC